MEKEYKNWKSALLKTGLPLEYQAAALLEKKGFYISEFTYTRSNEQEKETEFSVDLLAEDFFTRGKHMWAHLCLLIECKYTNPSVCWVFTPHPKESINSYGATALFNSMCPWLVDFRPLYNPYDGLDICIKGIELHQDDAHAHNVSRGLNQLRWATPQLANDLIKDQLNGDDGASLFSEFLCPILLTTAPLFVLKKSSNLSKIENAKDIHDVAVPVDALVCYQRTTTQLRKYGSDLIGQQMIETPQMAERLNALWSLRNTVQPRPGTYTTDLVRSVEKITDNVLVVNLKAFEKTIKNLRDSVKQCGVGLKRIGQIVPARSDRAVVQPLTPRGAKKGGLARKPWGLI